MDRIKENEQHTVYAQFFSFLDVTSCILINLMHTSSIAILLHCLKNHKFNRVLSLGHSRASRCVLFTQKLLLVNGWVSEEAVAPRRLEWRAELGGGGGELEPAG